MYRPAFFLGSLKRQATSRGIWTSRKAASSNAIPPDLAGVNISPAFDLTCLGGEDVLDGRSLRNQETKATGLEGMGRQVLTYCRSSGRLAQPMTMLALGTLKRTFSSMREGDPHISQLIDEYLNEDEDGSGFSLEGGIMMIHFNPIIKEAPLIRHLLCIDEHDIMNQSWFPLIDCLVKGGAILKPISPIGLMRPQDVLRSGGYETGNLGFHLIRQGSRLIAANLMRGINVSELMNLESILWSPNLRCLMFRRPHLVGDNEGASCPYKALYETIDAGVKLTTGCSLDNLPYPLPVYLDHFLSYLLNASSTDKRLITNHTATLFPGERIHRNMERNHVLRQRLPYEFGKTGRKRARKVFAELAVVFPPELLTSKGLHPAIDYWARKGSPTQFGSPPVILPLSADGSELGKWERKVVLGRTLIALFRDPFEHCYGPAYDHIEPICQTTYTRPQVDHLLNNLIPLSGPKADASILKWGLEPLFDIDSDTKPSYCNWTDISWVKNIPLVRPSAKPYTITKS